MCFTIRLIKAFDQSLWRISSVCRKIIYTMIFLIALFGFSGLVFFINGIKTIPLGLLCFSTALIVHILVALSMLILMVFKMYSFLIFVHGSKSSNNNSTSNSDCTRNTAACANTGINSISNDHESRVDIKDPNKDILLHTKILELITRLVVVYAVSLMSSLVVIFMYIHLYVLFGNQDYAAVRQTNIFVRIIYISECIISCMVLAMQNASAQPLYYRFCKICHVAIERCCLKCSVYLKMFIV